MYTQLHQYQQTHIITCTSRINCELALACCHMLLAKAWFTICCWRHEHHDRHGRKYFFTNQILFLSLNFLTVLLVGCWITLAMQCWNRNRVYSSVTQMLTTLRWHQRHPVNPALCHTWHVTSTPNVCLK